MSSLYGETIAVPHSQFNLLPDLFFRKGGSPPATAQLADFVIAFDLLAYFLATAVNGSIDSLIQSNPIQETNGMY